MLSSIKDKLLLSVRKNVSIFTVDDKEPKPSQAIRLNAGSHVLHHYQKQWEILHASNEENAKLAEEVDFVIKATSKQVSVDKDNFNQITHLLNNSNLKTNVLTCTTQMDELYDAFEKIENELVALEDLIEQIQLERMKKQHNYHLQQYKIRKNESLENFEGALKGKYEKDATEYESRRKQELQERQQVFQEAFRADLETFKSLGTIPKLDLPKKNTGALLEEIQVEYDESELDQFFEDEDPSNK